MLVLVIPQFQQFFVLNLRLEIIPGAIKFILK